MAFCCDVTLSCVSFLKYSSEHELIGQYIVMYIQCMIEHDIECV